MSLRILVCTVVHNPTDARVFRREIGAILGRGHHVTAIAPWKPDTPGDKRVQRVAVPRAVGRNRLQSLLAARARIRELAHENDLLILHDPELLVAIPWGELRRAKTQVVWDVHEDLAAAVLTKSYIPRILRGFIALGVRRLETWAENRCTLLLAERGYADRFAKSHPVVLNLPLVPTELPSLERKRQVIYVGSITQARGLGLMLELARRLAPHNISLRIIGETHKVADTESIRSTPNVEWNGALPNAQAMAEVEQSMVGLSLLADLPNYRHSMPTKVLEYMASGAIVVSTPLPLAVEVLEGHGVLLSGYGPECLDAAVAEIVALADDAQRREQIAREAYQRVAADYNWLVAGESFVDLLEATAAK